MRPSKYAHSKSKSTLKQRNAMEVLAGTSWRHWRRSGFRRIWLKRCGSLKHYGVCYRSAPGVKGSRMITVIGPRSKPTSESICMRISRTAFVPTAWPNNSNPQRDRKTSVQNSAPAAAPSVVPTNGVGTSRPQLVFMPDLGTRRPHPSALNLAQPCPRL